MDSITTYRSFITYISALLVLYLPHTASGRMIFPFLSKSLVFLSISLCAPVVSALLALDIVHSFTTRTGLDWTGLDWTGLYPPPPTVFVIVLLATC